MGTAREIDSGGGLIADPTTVSRIAVNDIPSLRPWWRLHRMTLAIGLVVAVALLLADGIRSPAPSIWREFNWPIAPGLTNAGWPFVTRISADSHVPTSVFLLNYIIHGVIVVSVIFHLELEYRRQRRQGWLQVDLRQCLLLSITVAIFLAMVSGLADQVLVGWTYELELPIPRLLCGYLPGDDFAIFAVVAFGLACALVDGMRIVGWPVRYVLRLIRN